VGLLLERHGSAGKTVIPLEFAVPAGPVIVEAEQPDDAFLSVTAKARRELVGDPLLHTYDKGFAGRAWAFLHSGRSSRLVVKAKGEWTVRVRDIASASPLDGSPVTRTGCDVLAYHGAAGDAVVEYAKAATELDTDSIHVHLLPAGSVTPRDVDWPVVSSDSGRHPLRLPGPCHLFVRTDGTWSIAVERVG
jgi:hypothetical protein